MRNSIAVAPALVAAVVAGAGGLEAGGQTSLAKRGNVDGGGKIRIGQRYRRGLASWKNLDVKIDDVVVVVVVGRGATVIVDMVGGVEESE